jgi:hypothetical protein
MDVLGNYLIDREDAIARAQRSTQWLETNAPLAPEARLLAFDKWVREQLAQRLIWPADPGRRARLIEQCRVRLETLVLDLWRRGWMLDGRRLATHILTALDAISAAQKKGGIRDFYAYFGRAVEAYVGANAEEIQMEARQAQPGPAQIGSLATSALAAFGVIKGGPSIPEMMAQRREEIVRAKAETLRSKLARERVRIADCNDAAGVQQELL